MAIIIMRPGLTVNEAATIAQVTPRTILRWIESSKLDALRIATDFFVPQDTLERALQMRKGGEK